ncbi:MAG: aldo/keto reductase [Acidobacteria bacterium]|nr:aldo/keto reductase [Acidobacteriota bacterium]
MDTIELGNTGLKVHRIGFGGIPIQRLSMEESDRILHEAIDRGIDFFDTARAYTDSEEKFGRVLPEYREKIIIATKTFSRDADKAFADVDISLKNMKTDYIDLYQLHNISTEKDMEKVLGPGGALEGLKRAKEQGKIGHIGVTGHKPWILLQMINHFETMQFPFNIIEIKAADELIPALKERKIGAIAMKPVAGGALKNVELNLRYILTHGMDVAIPGMDLPEQVGQNVSVAENLQPLNDEEMKTLLGEKDELGETFCRRCEYCMPCPQGLNISFLHLIIGYYFRYGLEEWALERLAGLDKKYTDCIACGECIKKCPYDLNTPKIFREAWAKIQEIEASKKV